MHNPYQVHNRKVLSPKQRLTLFIDHGGLCCICGSKIDAIREAWIVEHLAPLWLIGDNSAGNLAPAHAKCARAKTSGEATQRSKGRAVAEKHFGARPKSKWAGCRGSKWKKKLNGETVRR